MLRRSLIRSLSAVTVGLCLTSCVRDTPVAVRTGLRQSGARAESETPDPETEPCGTVCELEPPAAIAAARKIIARHQSEIRRLVHYTDEELAALSDDFRECYLEASVPRLEDISAAISPRAIHWVDMDWDETEELLFWTEGLAPTSWGPKEYLFIIRLEGGKSRIVKTHRFDPPPDTGVMEYRSARFWKYPNKDRGCNDFLRAVLSYASYGGSSSAFTTVEIGWNRYADEIFIAEAHTAFPVSVDGM